MPAPDLAGGAPRGPFRSGGGSGMGRRVDGGCGSIRWCHRPGQSDDGSVVRSLDVPGWAGGDQQEGYLAMLPSGMLAASAPTPGEIWLVDPAGVESPRFLKGGMEGVTALALLPDGQLLASQTWKNRLVRIPLEP